MPGIEVLQTFKDKYPARMNIIITAHANLENAVDSLNLGANAYIKKPIDHELLDKMIKGCLSRQKEALTITQEKLAKFIEAEIEKRTEEHTRTNTEQRLIQRFYQRPS